MYNILAIKMWYILLLLISACAGRIITQDGREYSTPYDMPRIVSDDFVYNVSGETTFNTTDVYNKIVFIDVAVIIDTFTLELQARGALAVVYTLMQLTESAPGRRVSEFTNLEFFTIPAVEIDYRNYLALVNETFVTLEFEDNPWTDMFRSAAFVLHKIVRGLVSATVIILASFILYKNANRPELKVVKVVCSLLIVLSTILLLSAIDTFGQDQLMPSKLAAVFVTIPNAFLILIVWLHIIVMKELTSKNLLVGGGIIQAEWLYAMIASLAFSIEVIFIGLSFYTDMGSAGPNILQLVGVIARMGLFLSAGILYLVYTGKLYKYVVKHHPKKDDKLRQKTKYTFLFNWILGPALIFKAFWLIAVLALLNSPGTYAVFWWIDMLVTSLIMLSLVLSPFLTLKNRLEKSSVDSTRNSSTTELANASKETTV